MAIFSPLTSRLLLIIHAALLAAAFPTTNITGPSLQNTSKRCVTFPYVFTAFTSSSKSNMFVYTSNDGTTFSLLKGPAYTPPTGLIRDPSIIHKDDKYYVAHTTSWFSADFAIASSTDLVNWSHVTTVNTESSFRPKNSWAPEFFEDPKTGKLHVVISLSTSDWGPFLPYVLTAEDSSLTQWSKPIAMSGVSDSGKGYIDTFPVFHKDQYHIFSKAETDGKKHIEHATADSLLGPYTFRQTGDFAGWGVLEGPSVTTLPDGTFRLYADGYDTERYVYSDSKDLFHWSPAQLVSNLSGVIRHGTVLRQT